MPHAPLIAITATTRSETEADPARVRLNAAYVDAVRRAGGIPVVAPLQPAEGADAILDAVDGVLLTGGEDIAPHLFGAVPHPALGRVTEPRDHWELAIARRAAERHMPTLAVCRGIQLLNVALGGTLIQDIPAEWPGALAHDQAESREMRSHEVVVVAGSRLEAVLGRSARVNSMHHQAIARTADGLVSTATAPDGIIEGVEAADAAWWAVGVQWHPEELDGADAALFRAFVDAARQR